MLADAQPTVDPKVVATPHADPEEVDISEHFYKPAQNVRPRNITPNPNRPYPGLQSNPSQIDDDALRAMMLGLPPRESTPQFEQPGAPGNPFAAFNGPLGPNGPGADDPMMAMLQQMMGGAGTQPGAMPSFPGLPPMDLSGQGADTKVKSDPSIFIWRIAHAIFALGFGLYISMATSFTGSREARALGGVDLKAFYAFATIEAVLQGTRLVFEKGRSTQNGVLGMILQFLPEPFKGYLKMFLNYRDIWTTTSSDVMILVFVLGAASYWNNYF